MIKSIFNTLSKLNEHVSCSVQQNRFSNIVKNKRNNFYLQLGTLKFIYAHFRSARVPAVLFLYSFHALCNDVRTTMKVLSVEITIVSTFFHRTIFTGATE